MKHEDLHRRRRRHHPPPPAQEPHRPSPAGKPVEQRQKRTVSGPAATSSPTRAPTRCCRGPRADGCPGSQRARTAPPSRPAPPRPCRPPAHLLRLGGLDLLLLGSELRHVSSGRQGNQQAEAGERRPGSGSILSIDRSPSPSARSLARYRHGVVVVHTVQ